MDKLHHWLVMKFPSFDAELTNLFIILKIKLDFIFYHCIYAIYVCVFTDKCIFVADVNVGGI